MEKMFRLFLYPGSILEETGEENGVLWHTIVEGNPSDAVIVFDGTEEETWARLWPERKTILGDEYNFAAQVRLGDMLVAYTSDGQREIFEIVPGGLDRLTGIERQKALEVLDSISGNDQGL